jgi:hypothetical protein
VEIEIDLRHWKLHILLAVLVGLLGYGVYSWQEYRWDRPWLRPCGHDKVVVRFDGVHHTDKEFEALQTAFLCLDFKSPQTIIHGFRPCDMTYDSREWPSRYSWVGMLGYAEPENLEANMNAFKVAVAAALQKTGIKVQWRFALVRRNGSVYYPE